MGNQITNAELAKSLRGQAAQWEEAADCIVSTTSVTKALYLLNATQSRLAADRLDAQRKEERKGATETPALLCSACGTERRLMWTPSRDLVLRCPNGDATDIGFMQSEIKAAMAAYLQQGGK